MKTIKINCPGLVFLYNAKDDMYIVKFGNEEFKNENPLMAAAYYEAKWGILIRRRIGEMYKREGKNPYTGKSLSTNAINTDTA